MKFFRFYKSSDKSSNDSQKDNPYLTTKFKVWIVALIFFLIYFHLYSLTNFKTYEIVSDKVLLGIVLVLVAYLWIQELRDRYRLESLNRSLVETQQQLEEAEVDTISVLILTEEAKDPYMKGHSQRVAKNSVLLAKEMGLNEDQQQVIERAGMLHDVGKLGIVDQILRKAGKLKEEEWGIVKGHPQKAVEILEPLKFLSKEKEIILQHHERHDGDGYPNGLKGSQVRLEAKIIALADTFDAMNSKRSYRDPLPRDKIIEELKRASGSQFDPDVVSRFLELTQKNQDIWLRE